MLSCSFAEDRRRPTSRRSTEGEAWRCARTTGPFQQFVSSEGATEGPGDLRQQSILRPTARADRHDSCTARPPDRLACSHGDVVSPRSAADATTRPHRRRVPPRLLDARSVGHRQQRGREIRGRGREPRRSHQA